MQVKDLQMIQILPSMEEQVAMQSSMVMLMFWVFKWNETEVWAGMKIKHVIT